MVYEDELTLQKSIFQHITEYIMLLLISFKVYLSANNLAQRACGSALYN